MSHWFTLTRRAIIIQLYYAAGSLMQWVRNLPHRVCKEGK